MTVDHSCIEFSSSLKRRWWNSSQKTKRRKEGEENSWKKTLSFLITINYWRYMKCYSLLLHTESWFLYKIKCSQKKKHTILSSQIPSFSMHRGVLLIPDSPDIFLNSATAPPVNSSCVSISPSLRSYRERIWHVQRLPAVKHHFKGAQNLLTTYQCQSK